MTKFVLVLLFTIGSATAYVPTVESLFRHGGNADVTADGVSLGLIVKKVQPLAERTGGILQDVSLLDDRRSVDYYKIYFSKGNNETLRLAQTRYNKSFKQNAIEHRVYYPSFTSYTIGHNIEQLEKGIFFALLRSLVWNDGEHMINYLKGLGVPVRLNSELLNRKKVELLASFKHYLAVIAKDREARSTAVNPLRPEDPAAREKADKVMEEPMYIDTQQVRLGRDNGQIAWLVNAGPFEAVFSYKERHPLKVKYKSAAGEFEITLHDYWLANGVHSMPKYINVKTLSGESYRVEVKNYRHYREKEDAFIKRLKKWDEILRGKNSTDQRPEFLL